MFLFLAVALISVAGFTNLLFQERKRIHLVAEFQAYQFATSLFQEFQSNPSLDFSKIDDLVGFGIYASSGDAVLRTAAAPVSVTDADVSGDARISKNRIKLLLRVGGGMPIREGRMRRPDFQNHIMGGGPLAGRYVFIEYSAPALANDLSAASFVGILASLALIFAFILIFKMFQRLESYRAKEADNRQLVALGEASRTLAHEIKNPLAIILLDCALIKKRSGGIDNKEILGIEEETNRIVDLLGRIRELLISGERVTNQETPRSASWPSYPWRM